MYKMLSYYKDVYLKFIKYIIYFCNRTNV